MNQHPGYMNRTFINACLKFLNQLIFNMQK